MNPRDPNYIAMDRILSVRNGFRNYKTNCTAYIAEGRIIATFVK